MIRKFRKYLKVINIDVHIYSMKQSDWAAFPEIGFDLKTEKAPAGKTRYFITDKVAFVHQSFLFPKLNILKLIGKKGPAIGDCLTVPEYKGKSIYPYVINHIAGEMLTKNNVPEIFIVVISDNVSSIRGIEKAGFRLHAKIKAKRFLLFYFNIDKQYLL